MAMLTIPETGYGWNNGREIKLDVKPGTSFKRANNGFDLFYNGKKTGAVSTGKDGNDYITKTWDFRSGSESLTNIYKTDLRTTSVCTHINRSSNGPDCYAWKKLGNR